MTRKGVPGECDKCSPWCAIKEKLDALWNRTHNAFTSLNGVEGDGTGNLQIEAGENITLEQSGNRVRITGEGGVEYTARSPLDIYENEIFARMGPVEQGRTWLVHADNINTQINAAVSAEADARDAADDDLQEQIDEIMDGTAVVGHAAEADTAGTADTISGVLPQANGGTGGTSLKTINGESIVGTGDIVISGGGGITANIRSLSTTVDVTQTSYSVLSRFAVTANTKFVQGYVRIERVSGPTTDTSSTYVRFNTWLSRSQGSFPIAIHPLQDVLSSSTAQSSTSLISIPYIGQTTSSQDVIVGIVYSKQPSQTTRYRVYLDFIEISR